MKKISKIAILPAFLSMTFLASCKKDENKGGTYNFDGYNILRVTNEEWNERFAFDDASSFTCTLTEHGFDTGYDEVNKKQIQIENIFTARLKVDRVGHKSQMYYQYNLKNLADAKYVSENYEEPRIEYYERIGEDDIKITKDSTTKEWVGEKTLDPKYGGLELDVLNSAAMLGNFYSFNESTGFYEMNTSMYGVSMPSYEATIKIAFPKDGGVMLLSYLGDKLQYTYLFNNKNSTSVVVPNFTPQYSE